MNNCEKCGRTGFQITRVGGNGWPTETVPCFACRPTDIPLPSGWTWEDVEARRAKWGIADTMVPVACAPGVTAWGTINSVRRDREVQS